MIKLFVDTPRLLQEGHIVHISKEFRADTKDFADKYFRIYNPQQVAFDLHWILPSGSNPPAIVGVADDYKDVILSNAETGKENLYPDTETELNEILVGFAGDVLVHPMIPGSRYFHKLAYTGMIPELTDDVKRYIGPWKPVDSPYYEPKLRFSFLYKLTPLKLRLYVDSPNTYEKVIIRLLINRCDIEKITPTQEEISKARQVKYYTELSKGVE